MRIAVGLAIALAIAGSGARAEAPEGVHMEVFSPLFSAYFGGALCDKDIDTDVAAEYVRTKIGEQSFSIQQVTYLAWFQVAQQTMQASMGVMPKNAREKAEFCRGMMSAFGPGGTKIPRILKN